jgi:hypothetical protein
LDLRAGHARGWGQMESKCKEEIGGRTLEFLLGDLRGATGRVEVVSDTTCGGGRDEEGGARSGHGDVVECGGSEWVCFVVGLTAGWIRIESLRWWCGVA